jgi:hypothetical protein
MSTPGHPGPHEGDTHRDAQSETVGEPHRDDSPPTRTKAPLLWIGLVLAAILVMAVLLIYAAVRAG